MSLQTQIDLSKYIETRLFGERPHIRGRRIPVATVAYNARTNHRSVTDLMDDFSLDEVQVLAALLYYEQHQTVIDAQEAAELQALAAMKRLYGDD